MVKIWTPKASAREPRGQEFQPEGVFRVAVLVVPNSAPNADAADEPFDREDAPVDDGREDRTGEAELAVECGTGVDVEVVLDEWEGAAVMDEQVPLEASPSSDGSGKR